MRFLTFLPLFILLQYSVCGQESPVLTEVSSDTGQVSAQVLGADDQPVDGVTILVNGEVVGEAGDALSLPLDVELTIVPQRDGWAFCPAAIVVTLEENDDLDLEFDATELGVRGIIVEDFTNISCNGCPEADEALWEAVGQLEGEITPIAWHGWWPAPSDPFFQFNIDAHRQRVQDFYELSDLPKVFINGGLSADHFSPEIMRSEMEAQQSLYSPVAMDLTLAVDGDEFTVEVTGSTLLDPGAGEWRIYLLLFETLVVLDTPGSNGQTDFRNSVRYVNFSGELMGEAIDLDPCAGFGATATFEIDDSIVVPDNLRALAFIQNSDDGLILDGAVVENGGP